MSRAVLNFLSLFTSLSTLLCCALPALFVTLGFGAALAGLLQNVPQLIWFSEHKILIFTFAGLMLLINGCVNCASANVSCPTLPEQAAACASARGVSQVVFRLSLAIFCLGAVFAFILPLLNS